MKYDALLVLSFGGPEGPDQVMPFLENVLRGRNVPRERMLEVAEHYQHFGGVSPINSQNRALITALETELKSADIALPIYWGNRNWHPLLPETLRQMQQDGVQNALVFITSAFSSYSGCRQYRENLAQAQTEVGESAPAIHKLRACFNHPGFIETMIDRTRDALNQLPVEKQASAPLLFTAHSIPQGMAATCDYEAQLHEAARLVTAGLGRTDFRVVYQSRSGPPTQPWLEPDISIALDEVAAKNPSCGVVVIPLGFVSDHMEVLFDLDHEAAHHAQELNLTMTRAKTAGTHPRFVRMLRELIEERLSDSPQRKVVGKFPARPDVCAADCCTYTPAARPARPQ